MKKNRWAICDWLLIGMALICPLLVKNPLLSALLSGVLLTCAFFYGALMRANRKLRAIPKITYLSLGLMLAGAIYDLVCAHDLEVAITVGSLLRLVGVVGYCISQYNQRDSK